MIVLVYNIWIASERGDLLNLVNMENIKTQSFMQFILLNFFREFNFLLKH